MDAIADVTAVLDAALLARDSATHDHSGRVIELAAELGKACGLSAYELKQLEACSRFHDVGKIGIPDTILHKPGKLSRHEYDTIKQHTTIGSALIRRINTPGIEDCARIVEHHHERFDGKGYPAGLAGETIPLLSRIVSIVDSFDAMTSYRHYHDARSTEFALETIAREKGAQFDPDLCDQFLNIAADLIDEQRA
jgi:response regulator RpfG family c-di-GMP phosphodiesterase